MKPRARRTLAALSALLLGSSLVYLAVRLFTFLGAAPAAAWAYSVLLIAGELFFFGHGFGYARNIMRSARYVDPPKAPEGTTLPPVAVFVCSFNEPSAVLRPTLTAALAQEYPAFRVYLVDDSTTPEKVAEMSALCDELGVAFLHRPQRRGFKAGALNDALKVTQEPLLLLLDADQRPQPGFLKDATERLLGDPASSFIQTPQVYGNVGDSLVAFAAEVQQAPFYDFGCAGKDQVNALFFLGTNVVLRRSAVEAAGGFAEDTITEDFVTSYRLHRRGGYRSHYLATPGVVGEGPPNLIAYFNQQYRWAHGNLHLTREFFRDKFRRTALTRRQRSEYSRGITWWYVGWANLALALLPPAFFFLGARTLGTNLLVYLAALIPFFLLSNLLGVLALRSRGYSGRGVLLAQSLSLVTFPAYIKASLDVARGRRVPFKVTRKGKGLIYVPFRTLIPQLTLLTLNAAAVAVGVWMVVEEPVLTLLIVLSIGLGIMGAWELLTRARELEPLKLARQRTAWRAFQVELVAFLVVTALFLVALDILDVSSRTPLVWDYFVSQWRIALDNISAAPYVLVNLFWAAYNVLFLYGLFMFRVDTK
jgi:cellulose synthase (UDP-forming)